MEQLFELRRVKRSLHNKVRTHIRICRNFAKLLHHGCSPHFFDNDSVSVPRVANPPLFFGGRSVCGPREARISGKRPVPTRSGNRVTYFPRFEAEVGEMRREQPRTAPTAWFVSVTHRTDKYSRCDCFDSTWTCKWAHARKMKRVSENEAATKAPKLARH